MGASGSTSGTHYDCYSYVYEGVPFMIEAATSKRTLQAVYSVLLDGTWLPASRRDFHTAFTDAIEWIEILTT
jgi:hypothetical protein